MASKKKQVRKHHVLISQGVAGLCIYLNGYRIVGEKPWGGGSTVKEWTCSDEDMATALERATPTKRPVPSKEIK